MRFIHIECLREWLNSKKTIKESAHVRTYYWKAIECELCKVRFPNQVFKNGSNAEKIDNLSEKQLKKRGKPIDLLQYSVPDENFLVFESVTLQNLRIIHVIDMRRKSFIRVGRGNDADIRVTDISVSRYHAKLNRSEDGSFYIEDNLSKFGTLLMLRKPYKLLKNKTNYLQMGRTIIQIRTTSAGDDSENPYHDEKNEKRTCMEVLCCQAPKKKDDRKVKKNREKNVEDKLDSEIYPGEFDPFDFSKLIEEDNSSDKSVKSDDEDDKNPTQGQENTRDDEQQVMNGLNNQLEESQNDQI